MACTQATARGRSCQSPAPRATVPDRTPSPPRRASSPGARQAAHQPCSALELAIRRNDLHALRRALVEDRDSVILPCKGGESTLAVALACRCSLDCWRALLDAGAQVHQLDSHLRTPIDAVLASPVPDHFDWQQGEMVPNESVKRLHTAMAIELLKRGAEPTPGTAVGLRNERCAQYVQGYLDHLVVTEWQRWARRELRSECFYHIAHYFAEV